MFKRRYVVIALLLVSILALAGCTQYNNQVKLKEDGGTEDKYPLAIVDSYGREITIESEPMRVISIAPNLTETIYALDQGKKLVGRTDWDDYPSKVKDVESIGSLMEPSIEKIIELKPDLVLVSTHFNEETITKLEELGIKVVGLYSEENFQGVYEVINKVGTILNSEDKANHVTQNMKKRISDIKSKVQNAQKPEIYYVVDFGEYGDFTAGKDTFINQMIVAAGGKNAASDVEGWKYSLERLMEKDPDILICSKYYDTKEKLKEANGYKDLTAVKKGRLYEIDNNILDRHGPRIADGVEALAKIFHPELFK